MDYKKYLPRIIVGLIFLIALLALVDVNAREILPTLLGFIIGGAMILYFIRRKSDS